MNFTDEAFVTNILIMGIVAAIALGFVIYFEFNDRKELENANYTIFDNIKKSLSNLRKSFKYDSKRDAGYYGKVDSKDFIGYEELCNTLNFTKGTLMPDDMGWLVFYYHGELLYIPQHPIRYDISWNDIHEAELVYGSKTITIGDNTYSVSLLTGASSDPVDDREYWGTDDLDRELELDIGKGSMWNELIYRVHEQTPGFTDKNEMCSGGPQRDNNWDELSDEDLNINVDKCLNGGVTLCQETSSTASSRRVHRGYNRLAHSAGSAASGTTTSRGWRPVLRYKLERIQNEPKKR